jgi:hypothetical protein
MKKQWFVLLLALTLGNSAALAAGADSPLLQPGKKTLYQRVLATPGTKMLSAPQSAAAGKPIAPFTAYYVYDRKTVGGQEWLQVGSDRFGTRSGWLPASKTLEWNKGLTVAFRDPVEHDRSLLFQDETALKQLVESRDVERYNQFYVAAEQGLPMDNSPVVAIQPAAHIDIQDDFYLVPIHQHEDIYIGTERARMLQVSSVPLHTGKAKSREKSPRRAAKKSNGYSAGLVFAIDSTLFMDPYIDRTREAVRKIYNHLKSANLVGNVNFGLVAYRDNVNAAPGINYLTRTYVTLDEGRDPATFLSKVDKLSAANASSVDFVEDAYAGVKRAIETMDWNGEDARYIVLITDAGPRGEKDPLSGTGMSAQSLRQLAQDNGIALFVLHLLTPATMADQAAAEKHYRQLSDFPGIGSLYYGVPTGDVQEFGYVLDSVAGQITRQVKAAAASAPTPPPPSASASASKDEPRGSQLAQLQEKVEKLGYALRMRYLLKHADGQIPNVFNAWLLDRDFRRPEQQTLDIRVLLTRDQLSDLHDILKQVLIAAEDGLLSPQNFLSELQSLAATISRDPEQLGTTTAVTAGQGNSLADLGFMREYIEDLPYTADVMNVSLDDWQSWSAAEQIRFINSLEAKISYYRALHDQTDLWVSLDGGPIDGDSVFPIALEMLP